MHMESDTNILGLLNHSFFAAVGLSHAKSRVLTLPILSYSASYPTPLAKVAPKLHQNFNIRFQVQRFGIPHGPRVTFFGISRAVCCACGTEIEKYAGGIFQD